MGQRKGGYRRKTRKLFTKEFGQKGKISLTRYFQQFTAGDRVTLLAEPAVQTGMYNPRFYGKVGTVTKKCGACYEISITDGGKAKRVIVHPVHVVKRA